MSVRHWWIAAVVCLIACLVLGGTFSQPSTAQAPAQPAVGRYQLSTVAPNGGSPGYVVVLDSTSGRCWQRSLSGGQWQDLGSPPGAK